MSTGASTPEELESLLENGFMLADRDALAELLEVNAVLRADNGTGAARGGEEIARAAATARSWRPTTQRGRSEQ